MDIIAGIQWPNGLHTRVWRRQSDTALVYWTGVSGDFPAVEALYEDDPDEGRVGINLIDLRHELLNEHEEQMPDTDRDLLSEIDGLLATVAAAA